MRGGRWHRTWVVVAVSVGALGLIWWRSGTLDVVETAYADAAAARTVGAVARGWVPDWVPPQATDLRGIHSLDTGESALRFTLAAHHAWAPPLACRPVPPSSVIAPRWRRDWVPALSPGDRVFGCPDVSRGPGQVPLLSALVLRRDGRHVYWRYLAP